MSDVSLAPLLGAGLDRLCAPRSIAIIGASDRAGSFGRRTQENLAHFQGDLHLVNPRREEIGGVPCHASVLDIPEPPDCVVIATPREAVEPLFDECVKAGVGGALVYASGFAEVRRAELVDLQSRLTTKARASGVRLIGPNSIGFVNFGNGAGVTFMNDLNLPLGFEADPARKRIALVSQSGGLGLAITQSMMSGNFFSHVLTCGNSCDVDVADYVAYLADDPGCDVIACNFEGVADPLRMRDAALKASAADKPLIVYKMAEGEAGARAAAAHTGCIAGSHDAYRSMFDLAGAVMVEEYEALLETASFFAKARPNKGEGMAVVATSGGAAIMAADAAERRGVPLPQPDADLRARLAARVPEYGSPANPCDVTAQVLNDMASLIDCAEGFLEREEYGAFLIPHLFAYKASIARIPLLDELAARHGKVICAIWVSAWLEGPGAEEMVSHPNTVLFRSTDRCFAAFALWRQWLRRKDLTATAGRISPDGALDTARVVLEAASGRALRDDEMQTVLSAYGLAAAAREQDAASVGAVELAASGEPDALFGPLISIRHGGALAEVLDDAVTAPAPVSPLQAERLLRRLRHATVFEGAGGAQPVDMGALATQIARISELVADNASQIDQIDINSLVCKGADVTAADVRILCSDG